MRDIKDYTDKYVDEPFEAEMVKIRKRMVIEQCKKYKHENILEIGCGLNPFFLDFKEYKHMIIVEPGRPFADNAEKLSNIEDKQIQIINGFFEEQIDKIKEIETTFDFIILSSIIHELDEPQKMLQAVRELCRENTVVHINVPNANSMHRLLAVEAGLISDAHEKSAQMLKMQRRRTYDMDILKEEMEQAGFQVIDSGSYFIKPFTHLQMQRCIDEGIIDDRILNGFEKLVKYMPELGAGIYVNIKKSELD